ncbi:DUF2510 domain-containing protein [Streptomyces sp. NPDC056061]|uniref:DUF2510 domain-containing protein n=1 Tax=Streptomyces sp. NPDC056061 TaxID=3345700 RepID=UPI0035DE4683
MSNTTPPGWYPDAATPSTERWWDGAAWTAHTRPSPAADGFGPPVPMPSAATGDGRTGAATRTIALVTAGLVVIGAAVTGAVLLNRDDGTTPPVAVSGTPVPLPTTGTDTPAPSPTPTADTPGVLVDQLNGITLPVPDGWERPEHLSDSVLTMRTVESYACPGDSSHSCYHGTITTRTVGDTAVASVRKIAEQDIAAAADDAYEKNPAGDRIHGGITSHRQLAAEPVSVAGRAGYRVRWQVTTGKGPGGYVQTLVFPSTVGSESPVVVRFALDAGPDGPPLSLMDTVTAGIRPMDDSDTSGGVGSSVAP